VARPSTVVTGAIPTTTTAASSTTTTIHTLFLGPTTLLATYRLVGKTLFRKELLLFHSKSELSFTVTTSQCLFGKFTIATGIIGRFIIFTGSAFLASATFLFLGGSFFFLRRCFGTGFGTGFGTFFGIRHGEK